MYLIERGKGKRKTVLVTKKSTPRYYMKVIFVQCHILRDFSETKLVTDNDWGKHNSVLQELRFFFFRPGS